MKIQIIAVVGTKKSGKTTTIENLIREMTRRNYRVAAIKHIPERDHTIDTPEKDTWRYAQAGAKTIVSVAEDEIATLEKMSIENVTLGTLVKKCRGNDLVFLEGLKKMIAKKKDIPKIVVNKNREEATNALEEYAPVLAFSGPYSTKDLNPDIPYADALKNSKELADILEKHLSSSSL